ncbi:hypothetical protein [Pseudomonas putida]|uniref:hypothetical protein n=1 Tax=Pseudomonas putida TaxID=303 RepID=UPI003D992643
MPNQQSPVNRGFADDGNAAMPEKRQPVSAGCRFSAASLQDTHVLVGAAEGCDLLILLLKKQNQKIAAFGSSYVMQKCQA